MCQTSNHSAFKALILVCALVVSHDLSAQETPRDLQEQNVQRDIVADTFRLRGPNISRPPSRNQERDQLEETARQIQDDEEDEFAPLGIRFGTFLLFPRVEASVGYTDNIADEPEPTQSGILLTLRNELRAISNWNRHELELNLRGSYTMVPDDEIQNEESLNLELAGRIDVTDSTEIDLGAEFETITQDEVEDKRYVFLGGLTQRFNRLSATINARYEKFDFDDGLRDLDTASASASADYDETTFSLRLGYDVTDRTTFFGTIGTNRREFVEVEDEFGLFRGSDGFFFSAGVQFNRDDIFTGELSVGYQVQDQDDPLLDDVSAVTFDLDLTWSPTALTDINLIASTGFGEAPGLGTAGSVDRQFGINLTHRLMRDVNITASTTYTQNEFEDIDLEETTWLTELGAQWLLSREIALLANYSHERFSSNFPETDFTTNIFSLGVRLQR